MSSKSKTLSAVGYASADIFLQVIRENMTSKMVAEAQELSKNTDGLALVYTISREDIDGAGVWREEKVYQYRNSDGGKCILMIGSGGEHTVWHIATADGYQPGSGCLLMTVQESLLRQMDRCTGGACAQKHGRNFDVNKSKQTTGRLRPEF